MKTLKNNLSIFVVALVTLFSVAFTSSAKAADTKGTSPVTVKYVGTANDLAIFQVVFVSDAVAQYEISITDKYSSLYYENVKGTEIIRNYQFYSTDMGGGSANDEILVTVKNTLTKEVTTYKILPNANHKKEAPYTAKL